MSASFFDGNVLLYLASGDAWRANRAEKLLVTGGTISVQVLNEVANASRLKLRLSWEEIRVLLETLKAVLNVQPLTVETHDRGMFLAQRHGFSTYDAMIVAAALLAGCDTLWSEDMQNGMIVEEKLRIVNPFAS
ncbi:PIN domain-containing protein [Aquamicrobium sp. LC103]|uniref:PIN domain-containing protein n=1 Tax=Aquamicrobium sp. LC103 TaxID=1120658 RepID=UPI00063EA55A|nr:PIN domain-containing protein [Aquamicrobium sp. LC103]TKT77587.1 PIN domain-containing protein [Aquamicrobium sp. LC103]